MMKHSDFRIGVEFTTGAGRWRCTDIGTRVITAIRLDEVRIATVSGGVKSMRALCYAEANAEGWFNGPPYAVAESVFDEDGQEGCTFYAGPQGDSEPESRSLPR
jgi:hypothetical protein